MESPQNIQENMKAEKVNKTVSPFLTDNRKEQAVSSDTSRPDPAACQHAHSRLAQHTTR